MKQIIILLFFTLIAVTCYSQPITPSNKPNKTQEAMAKRGYGMFIHFGINTFLDTETSNGSKNPASKYNPTNLDCDQWVRVARDAGFRYVLLVTKHGDGFCLWDSKYTTYDVASSPVKTDVVAEVSKACKKYGLEFAIYYCLPDSNNPSYKDDDKNKYVDYVQNQLEELFTNYGDICELWLDAPWARKLEDWQLPRLYNYVKKLQPNCAISSNHTIKENNKNVPPDSMIVDNRYPAYYFPSDFRLWDPIIAHKLDKKQYQFNGESYYLPYEHTICLSKAWNWFQKSNYLPVRDLDELEELFYWCTDNSNLLVVNVPPDNTGRIREHEENAIIELGKRLGIKRGKPLPRNGEFISIGANTNATSTLDNKAEYNSKYAVDGGMQTRWAAAENEAILTIDLDPKKEFNKLSIFECQDVQMNKDKFSNSRTNRIQEYKIEILENNIWKAIYVSNESMKDCKVINFPKSYKTSAIRLNISKSIAPPSIYEFNVIFNKKVPA